jgi:hypothetical protein
MPVDISGLTAADFEPQLESSFHIPLPTGELELRLAEVRRLGKAMREGGAFSLTFISSPGPFLAQAIYPLAHLTLGTFDLFLVPLGPKDGGNCYEAVFT